MAARSHDGGVPSTRRRRAPHRARLTSQAAEQKANDVIELVALDMAGTTVNEGGAVYVALREAVVAGGGELTPAQVAPWMGADKRQAIAALTLVARNHEPDAEEVERTYEDFLSRLLEAYRTTPPTPIEGVPEAFAALRAAGVKVALTTGFSADVHEPLLASLGWSAPDTVDTIVCTDDVPAGRPAPYMIFRAMERTGVTDVARVLVAGDTPRDLQAGMNAGVGTVVGVATGELTLEDLGTERHTHLLPSLATLPLLVARL
ncbi:MAG: phosphonatase-like hydrolase [Acidimicrobiia bacterium]|nr:phosphonatase-like hydrolase [Acidimicrobiia bacterium]